MLLALFITVFKQQCYGQGNAIYLSTPLTPPAEMVWLVTVSLVGLSLAGAVSFRIVWRYSYSFAASAGPAATIMFALVFFLTGRLATHNGTAPGLGMPLPALTGLAWSEVGSQFVLWNCLGLLQFVTIIVVIGMVANKLRSMAYALPLVLYTVAITAAIPWLAYYILHRGSAGIPAFTALLMALLLKQSRLSLIIIAVLTLILPDYFAIFCLYSLFFFPVLEATTHDVCRPNRLEIVCLFFICAFVYFLGVFALVSQGALAHGPGAG